MQRTQKHRTIQYKIIISYIVLVLIGAAAINILYKGIHNITLLDTDTTKPNGKLKYINQLLTDVYEAEGFSRSYFLYRKDTDLVQYIRKSDHISLGIDSLIKVSKSNSSQIRNLNEIKLLLDKKELILGQLVQLSKNLEPELAYSRIFDEVYLNTYENLYQPIIIEKTTDIKRDSFYLTTDKAGILRKVKKIFSSSKKNDQNQLQKTTIEQFTTYDTIYQPMQISDIMLKNLKKALVNFKSRDEFFKQQSVSQETQLLHSDKIILDKIRNLIASLETDEIIHTSSFLDKSRFIIKQANYSVIILGGLAFILVFVFLALIYRDIDRSKAYESELMRARQHADELVKMKEQFVASVSHEIRTPLSAIVGFTEQLKKNNSKETEKICLENIQIASYNLHSLVNNILDISKSNAGKIVLESIPFQLKDTLYEIYLTFSNEASRKGIDFQIHIDESANIMVYGDKYRFVQIINNLINNAIKFTEHGMVDLISRISSRSENQVDLEIIVFDTGIGISDDKIDQIFDEFTQADNDITRKFGGTGLGLSIAKKIVTLMQGTITVTSKEKEGSTFIVNIPFVPSGTNSIEKIAESFPTDEIQNKKILIVEDDETLQVLIEQIIKNNHLNGKVCSNATLGLDLLINQDFDIVFTDIQMPGISGIEFCEQIKNKLNLKVPVIAFSARSAVTSNAGDFGFDGFLSKPFTEIDFLRTIGNTLNLNFVEKEGIVKTEKENSSSYSFAQIKDFTGNDKDSLKNVVSAFIENTTMDIENIRNALIRNDFETVSKRIHKLLPMFKQLLISRLIEPMQILERFKELELSDSDFVLFTERFIENAEKIIEELKMDDIFNETVYYS